MDFIYLYIRISRYYENMSVKKLKIAVTGGIGSGKSEFCNYLNSKGLPVISADKEAKELLANDASVREKIISIFGKDSYKGNTVNTKYLAEKVFSDPQKVIKINSIIHPRVIKKIKGMMNSLLQQHSMVFVEAALIYEAEMEDIFDYVILITAGDNEKIHRIQMRDKSTEESIRQRMENQIPDEIKKDWADFTFENNSGLQELHAKADFLITILRSINGEK